MSRNDDISRRDFLARTGVAGLGLTMLGPGIARALPLPAGIPGDRMAPEADALTPLFSGLRWRMLGPFRGGRVDAVERRARAAERVLLRLRQRRRVEVDRRGPRVDAGLRLAAGRVDRRDRGRAVGARHRLRRQRRIDAARFHRLRQRHVQVHRRRQDVDAHRPRRARSTSARSPSIRRIRTSCSSRRSVISTRRIRIAACFESTRRRQDLAEGPLQERQTSARSKS